MIFCVEDDNNIRELIIYTLKTIGFEAYGFVDFEELYVALKKDTPELILLDIMLPKKDGLTILKELKESRTTKDIPIIMVTAKGSEFDKVSGLDLGADDYIAKPFGMMEMVSRIKAVLRRCEKNQEDKHILSMKNVSIDTKKHVVKVNNEEITLSFKEYEILRLLFENQGVVLTRDNLLNKIWGYDYDGENRTVDVHIRTLRSKLGEGANVVQTIRNVGYKLGE